MKTLFHIRHTGNYSAHEVLLIECGDHHCVYATYDVETSMLTSLKYLNQDERMSGEVLADVIRMISSDALQYTRVVFCSAQPYSVLVPRKYFSDSQKMLQALFPEPTAGHHDTIPAWQVVNSYGISRDLDKVLTEKFPEHDHMHAHTVSLKSYNGYNADNQIAVHFTPRDFRVVVKRHAQLVLVQMYGYTMPLDVVYYLLKITEGLDLPKDQIHLILSGLIEENSSLYRELHNYFRNIDFELPKSDAVHTREYPQHYFTSMYNLGSCVS